MKVAVLNGSPKGRFSTTLHSVLYLQKKFPDDSFEIVEVASRIRALEKDLSPVSDALERADLVLFSYPVYTFLVPYQLHRAIELIKERGVRLEGKFAAQLTTSKHFYDVTAHRFIEDNAADLGMTYVKGLSADMDDLLTDRGREELLSFWDYVRFRCGESPAYMPGTGTECAGGRREIAVVAADRSDEELSGMIARFAAVSRIPVRTVYLSDAGIKGGCISCFNCASDGVCIYNDSFSVFLKEQVYSASAVVYAFRIKDHSMGSAFKLYDDRQFCNGHRMMTIGMPVGYIVKGSLKDEPNLQMLMEARAEVGRNILCRIVSDDSAPGDMERLASELAFALDRKVRLPQNFYGVGGTRIFRDLIWLMRGLMKADHRFYKSHGIYDDFPQRHIGKMLQIKLIGLLFNNRAIRRRMGGKLNEGMVQPYRRTVDEA